MKLDLEWPTALHHRKGGEVRLCGIDVFYDFAWLDVFPDRRTQFRNGQSLARFVQEQCPSDKTPALLLTFRDDVAQGFRQTPGFLVFVVNLEEYTSTDGDAARSYLASHLTVDLTDLEQLANLAATADPEALRQFIASHVTLPDIEAWLSANEEHLQQLRELVGIEQVGSPATLGDLLRALDTLQGLSTEDLALIAALFGPGSDREQRVEVLHAVTRDPTGRYVTGEVIAERTPERVQDARDAMDAYQALLGDEKTNESAMQRFIEENLWLLGLDYAKMRPRQPGPGGTTDFLLQRFDGFYDLLELKSPHDSLIEAPEASETGVPAPHEYKLSRPLAQALAQAIVYRDRFTRFADSAEELFGLPQSRDPRIIIVIGEVRVLPEHRQRVLQELNKSLHRVEVVPYDVLGMRASAMLDNVERYLVAADEAARAD